MIAKASPLEFILGLDVGPASVGWAIIDLENGEPDRIEAAGVRRFEAGVQGDIEGGRDESRATQRRDARFGQPVRCSRRIQSARRCYRRRTIGGTLPVADSP